MSADAGIKRRQVRYGWIRGRGSADASAEIERTEAQGDTGLQVEQCGKMSRSHWRTSNKEVMRWILLLKDQIGLALCVALAVGWGGGGWAGALGRGQGRRQYRDRRQYGLNVRYHVFIKSSNNHPGRRNETQGLGLSVKDSTGWPDTQMGWDGWAEWLIDLQGYRDWRHGQVRQWQQGVVQLRRSPQGCQFFYTGKHQDGSQAACTPDWGSYLQSRAKYFNLVSRAVFTLSGMSLRAQGLQNLSVQTRLYLVLDGRTEYPVAALFLPSNFLTIEAKIYD